VSDGVVEIAGRRAWLCAEAGPPIASEREAADIIGETFGAGVRLVVIPAARLPDAFLDLKSGLAGAVLQKFVNYGRHVAILGDLGDAARASRALGDFIGESNRGRSVWFVSDRAALEEKLATL